MSTAEQLRLVPELALAQVLRGQRTSIRGRASIRYRVDRVFTDQLFVVPHLRMWASTDHMRARLVDSLRRTRLPR